MWWWMPCAAAAPDPEQLALDAVAESPFSWSTRVSRARVGPTWVRVRARAGDVEVVGADRRVAVANGRVLAVYGPRPRWPTGDEILSEVDAVAAGTKLAGRLGRGPLFPPRARKVAFDGRFVWQVNFGTRTPLRTWRTFVDAETGALLHTEPISREAQGNVYSVSPAVSEPEEVTLPRLLSEESLTGAWADAVTCDESTIAPGLFGVSICDQTVRLAVPDSDGNYLFDPAPASLDDPMAEVGAYYHLDRVAQWTVDTFGTPMPEGMKVHVNFPMRNAFFGDFDGDGNNDVSLGQADDGIDFAYDADVVYHEYGHALVAEVGQLGFVGADEYGLDWTAGAANEGFADVISLFLTGDPSLAEYAGTAGGDTEPIRDVEEDRHCPEHLYGEVHRDGELLGALFWNLLSDEGLRPDVAEALAYGAVQIWEQHPSWPGIADGILASAELLLESGDLEPSEGEAISRQVEAFGLADCPRVLDLEEGDVHSQNLINLGLYLDFAQIPGELQYRFVVPDGATSVVLVAESFEVRDLPMGFALYARRGAPVGHRVQTLDVLGIAVAVPEDWDVTATGYEDGTGLSLPDVVPGETWYFSIASVHDGDLAMLDFASAELTVTIEVRDEATEGETPPRACACGTTPASSWPMWLFASGWLRTRRDARRRPE